MINEQGKIRGFAYIEYEEADDAKQAIDNYDEAEIFGYKNLVINRF